MIRVNQLRKRYGDFCLDCSFEVKPGTITGLIGKNGSGKTTAFKTILGLVTPDSGQIKLFDKKRGDLNFEDQQKIAVVFSDSGFNEEFAPKDLIPILRNFYPTFDEEYYFWEVKRQEFPLDKPIRKFSSGMKARLKIIIALAINPKLLILDEPTASLDVTTRNEIYDQLKNFMDEDEERSILISSHHSKDLEALCDDILLIDNGKIIYYEEIDKILNEYGLIKATKAQFADLVKDYILRYQKTLYGYYCLTNQRQFYLDNYPEVNIESGNLDEVITLITDGEIL